MTGAAPETPALRTARVRLGGAAILIVFALALALDLAQLLPLQSAWLDASQRMRPREAASTPVTIVEIDDKSLAALGRWPWPRTLLAQLVHTINAFSPGSIGVDIVMPEPDPLSPERALAYANADAALLDRIASLPSNDAELASAFTVAPVVVAIAGAPEAPVQALRVVPILVRDAQGDTLAAERAISNLMRLPTALSSLATLNDAAHGWGLISVPDSRGTIRQAPLVVSVRGTLAPALALEMWRVALHESSLRLMTADGMVRAVAVGNRSFATEDDGTVRLYFSHHQPARFVSAVDVLQGSVGKERLGRTFVLIGVTALALGDVKWTPVGERMHGVEMHAQLLENLNDNDFLLRPRWAPTVEAAGLLLVGGLLIWMTPRWSVRYALIVAAGSVAVFLVSGYALFRVERLLVDAASPAAGLVLLFGTLLGLTLGDTARNRKALQRVLQLEREAAARLAGELQAARRIQLDTLPHPESLHDPRVELAASMEPALEVGGDLYDFYLLDSDRLFFMLGDVSGKGLSASIFMAVSKALCKSTMLRASDADLGALLSQSNREVGRDNPGALFVTMFAGVLDLRSGELEYSNAGHENPWLIRAGGGVTRLAEGGGPPFCVVDDFAYRSVGTRLRPGDLLCIVSDGVTEAHDPAGALFGTARVEHVLVGIDTASAAVDALRKDVQAFAAGTEPADDMSVLALRWCGP